MNRRCWGRSTVLGWMRGHVPHVLLGLGLTLCYLGVLSVPNNRALGDSSTTVTPPGPGVPCTPSLCDMGGCMPCLSAYLECIMCSNQCKKSTCPRPDCICLQPIRDRDFCECHHP